MSKILSLPAALAGYVIASPLASFLSVFIVRRFVTTTISAKASLPQGNIGIQYLKIVS